MKRQDIEYTFDADEQIIQDCADNRNDYICDAISETADANIEIYTAPLLEWAAHNSEWCDQATANGLVDPRNSDNVIVKVAQAGQYEYFSSMLYENIAAICLNWAFDYLKADEMPDDLAEQISDKARDFGMFSEIGDLIDEYNQNNQ